MNLSMEASVFGVFVSGALLAAAVAGLLQFPARRWLTRIGVYRLVWHRNLFDVCLYVVLWGLVVWVFSAF
jgi:hypothetical protein